VARIPERELAELAPCTIEHVCRLEELGLLERGEDGLFPSSDVHLVRLMAAFEEAGISIEDVARGVASGDLSFPLGMFMPEPVGAPDTFEQLGERLGRSPELLRRLSGELGLPRAPEDRIRAADAEMLSKIVTTLDLATDDELSRFARLYGGTLQRLVTSGLAFFDRTVRERVATFEGLSNDEKDQLVYMRAAPYTELVASVVPWLQGRHREHSVLEYLVSVTEGFMDERGIVASHPPRLPAIAFLDLTGYTALAEEQGDRAAADLAAGLATVVQDAAQVHGGRAVKWLGDGVMFHFADSRNAILSALDLVEQAEQAMSVPARIGINAGAVIAQEGDYFGRTVNIASRIADYAQPHEVLVSEAARQHAGDGAVAFELVGDVQLKGVPRAVRLHRASRV
jgi:adenylate cyclase